MKKSLLSLFFLWLICAHSPLAAQPVSRLLDSLLTIYAANEQFNGVALVAKGDSILLHKGYGLQNAEKGLANQPDGIFQIGSITKQFTATVIMQLVEEKKLSLYDKLSRFYPDFPKADSVTVHQLLNHTSGIYSYTDDWELLQSRAHLPITEAEMMTYLAGKPYNFPPGSEWSYNNSAYCILGYIIEKCTGKPYEANIRVRIFDRAGMTSSGFDFARLDHPARAVGYDQLSEIQQKPSLLVDSSFSGAGGAIYSTAGDLLRWHQALLRYSVLSPESYELATTPFREGYGYGWAVDSALGVVAGNTVTQHSGGIFGFTSWITRVQADGVVVILLNNIDNPVMDDIRQSLMALVYGQPVDFPQVRESVQVSPAVLSRYAGEYQISEFFVLEVLLENDRLLIRRKGEDNKMLLFAQSETSFFMKTFPVELEFVQEEGSEGFTVVIHQEGRGDQKGKRL